jgi:hypothetical protein
MCSTGTPLGELSKLSGVSQQSKETINNCSTSVSFGRHSNSLFHCFPQDVAHLHSQQGLIPARGLAQLMESSSVLFLIFSVLYHGGSLEKKLVLYAVSSHRISRK